jgi:hypothetical protein
VWLQPLAPQTSLVQAILSLHSALPQQMAQPLLVAPATPVQHLVPLLQPSKWHAPPSHFGLLWQAPGRQSVLTVHIAAFLHPAEGGAGSHT